MWVSMAQGASSELWPTFIKPLTGKTRKCLVLERNLKQQAAFHALCVSLRALQRIPIRFQLNSAYNSVTVSPSEQKTGNLESAFFPHIDLLHLYVCSCMSELTCVYHNIITSLNVS